MQECASLNDDKTKMPSVCVGMVKIAWQNDI